MAVVSVCQGYICIHDSELVNAIFPAYRVTYSLDESRKIYAYVVLHSGTWYCGSIQLNLGRNPQNLLRYKKIILSRECGNVSSLSIQIKYMNK